MYGLDIVELSSIVVWKNILAGDEISREVPRSVTVDGIECKL